MNDLERGLTDLFHRRAAGAAVVDALDDVVDGARLATVEHPPVAGRRRTPIVAIAAALVILASLSVAFLARATLRTTPSTEVAARVQFPTTAPTAPMVSDQATSAVLQTVSVLTRDDTGLRLGDLPLAWPPSDQSVTDLDETGPAALYVATCCSPGADIWRDGEDFEPGIRLDYLIDRVVKARIDPATDTIRIGSRSLRVADALDVAVQDPYRVLVLIGGTNPAILDLISADFDLVEPRRERTSLQKVEGMCGLAALSSVTMVLVGTTDASGRCVADRALALDSDDHHLLATLRFPASFVVTNSDHQGRLVGVTADGRVLVGTLGPSITPTMAWVTLSLPLTAVAAAFR